MQATVAVGMLVRMLVCKDANCATMCALSMLM
jgi:hypothetical protein